MHHIRNKMVKFKGSSCFTPKVRAFFEKLLTAIFVIPCQSPCKSVKTENDVTSSKIKIFKTFFNKILMEGVFWHYKSIYVTKIWNCKRFSDFFSFFSKFFPKKWHFWRFWNKIPNRDIQIQIYFKSDYKSLPLTFTLQKN